MNGIQWNNHSDDYLCHYGVRGMQWGKRRSRYTTNANEPDIKYYYGKDGKVHTFINKSKINPSKYPQPSNMTDYATTYYDQEGNRHTFYNPTDEYGNPDKSKIKEHITKEEEVRSEKLASDLKKAKNPLDVGKAYIDFIFTSVNKFVDSIFKKK